MEKSISSTNSITEFSCNTSINSVDDLEVICPSRHYSRPNSAKKAKRIKTENSLQEKYVGSLYGIRKAILEKAMVQKEANDVQKERIQLQKESNEILFFTSLNENLTDEAKAYFELKRKQILFKLQNEVQQQNTPEVA